MSRLSRILALLFGSLCAGCAFVNDRIPPKAETPISLSGPPPMIYADTDHARYPDAVSLIGRSRKDQMPSANALGMEGEP